MSGLLKINQLSLAFEQEGRTVPVIDEVSLTIQSGEVLALLGESGCGKSAMAMAIMRLLPRYAAYGKLSEIKLKKTDLLVLPDALMRMVRGRKIGVVFQEPMTALNPVLTIRTQLAEAFLKHKTLSSQALELQMIAALKEVEMPEPELKLSQYPHQLSGGQKQRVVLAMALASDPDLLIADEPTTALDVTIQAQILSLLKRLQAHRNMSILFITHDLGVVKAVANRVCVMYAGEIVELAKVDDFFGVERHPYVSQLLTAMPTYEKRQGFLNTITGQVPSPGSWPEGCRFHPRCHDAFELCKQQKPELIPVSSGLIRCHLFDSEQKQPLLQAAVTQSQKTSCVSDYRKQQSQSEVLLKANQVSVFFPGAPQGLLRKRESIKAVDQVSFEIEKGKTLGIVGESGSGKTTLSRALLGLYPLAEGDLFFRGERLLQPTLEYRRAVQMVFQDPYTSLNPKMTIAEILAEGMLVRGLSKQKIQQKQRRLLDQVYLPLASLYRYPHEFSGGQRQRISIARALSTDPELLICDEPTSALDVSVQAQILNLFKELQKEHALAYLFITHNISVVSYLADDVLVMKAGQVVEKGSVEQILFHPAHVYTQQLLSSVLSPL